MQWLFLPSAVLSRGGWGVSRRPEHRAAPVAASGSELLRPCVPAKRSAFEHDLGDVFLRSVLAVSRSLHAVMYRSSPSRSFVEMLWREYKCSGQENQRGDDARCGASGQQLAQGIGKVALAFSFTRLVSTPNPPHRYSPISFPSLCYLIFQSF